MQIFEIHKYKGDELQYVVAKTNKHSENYVREDVEKMNSFLTQEMKAEGIRYVFALGTFDSMMKKAGYNKRAKKEAAELAPSS